LLHVLIGRKKATNFQCRRLTPRRPPKLRPYKTRRAHDDWDPETRCTERVMRGEERNCTFPRRNQAPTPIAGPSACHDPRVACVRVNPQSRPPVCSANLDFGRPHHPHQTSRPARHARPKSPTERVGDSSEARSQPRRLPGWKLAPGISCLGACWRHQNASRQESSTTRAKCRRRHQQHLPVHSSGNGAADEAGRPHVVMTAQCRACRARRESQTAGAKAEDTLRESDEVRVSAATVGQ